MRILVVNEYAGKLGGVEQYLANVVPALARRQHQLGLLYYQKAPRDADEFLAMFQASFLNLDQAMADFQPDVLYLHRLPSISPFLGLQQRRVRYIHDHDLCCPRRHKYYWWNARACQHKADWRCWVDLAFVRRDRNTPLGVSWFSLAAHRREMLAHQGLEQLLVGSRSMQKELADNGLAGARVLAPLVPLVEQEAPPLGHGRILYVGQLIRGKGVDLLLQALHGLAGDWSARLVGDGNARAGLEKQIQQLGLASRVKLEGWVSAEQLHEHYREAQLVVVPSRWPEPFGMVGLEAMNWGRPVVGFDIGGIPDWLEHGKTGWLVPTADVDGLRKALDSLLSRPELCQLLGRQGQQRVHQHFAFEAMVDQLDQILAGA